MIVIFGGTGTLGHALAEIIHAQGLPCTIVSRCELRQKEMAKIYPDFRYVIGDVTNQDWREKIDGKQVDCVFNLSAMKHVDTSEANVRRCVDINYGGVVNTYRWANWCGIAHYIFSSTDKAVLPINAYGMAKGLGERYLYEKQGDMQRPTISCFRWGNVLGSRGSVFHMFAKSLIEERKVYVTDPRMSRFWIHIRDVARFMWDNRAVESVGTPHIPPMKAAPVLALAEATADVLGIENYDVDYTGIRPGEKIHECLFTSHDYCITSDKHDQYTSDELRTLVMEVIDDSATRIKGRDGAQISEHPSLS